LITVSATTAPYTPSLHDALPIWDRPDRPRREPSVRGPVKLSLQCASASFVRASSPVTSPKRGAMLSACASRPPKPPAPTSPPPTDRKSTRLNSSHVSISYAVFCL